MAKLRFESSNGQTYIFLALVSEEAAAPLALMSSLERISVQRLGKVHPAKCFTALLT